MIHVEHIMLLIEHSFFVFYVYFCIRKREEQNIMDIFEFKPRKGAGTLRMGDSDELVLVDNQEREQELFAWVIATSWCWWIALAVCLLAE